jgi:hypothetical protein
MTKRRYLIRTLLLAYPRRWRREYGEELADILEGRQLTFRTVWDVLQSGALQRTRDAKVWQVGGLVLEAWLILGTALNSIEAFPRSAYNLFWQFDLCICLVIGYLSVSRNGKSRFAAAQATARAALIGIIPELLLALMWVAGFVHPTILQLNGTPMVLGHGITDMCIRAEYAVRPTDLLLAPLVAIISAFMVGAIGATTCQFILAFRKGFYASKG